MEEPVNILPPKREGEIDFTNLPEVTYEDKIGSMLIAMPVGGVFEIEKNVKTENRERFTNSVKSYIDRDFGKQEGFEILFNTNYTKIRKAQRYTPSKKTKPQQ